MGQSGDEEGRLMKCFECGGEVIQTIGSVRMTKKAGYCVILMCPPTPSCPAVGGGKLLLNVPKDFFSGQGD